MRNKFEKDVAKQLRRKKVKFEYETERIPYVISSVYVPDFILSTPVGNIYVECKGYFRPEDKRKLAAVKRQHPEIDIRILFCRLNAKQHKQYTRWCIKHKFPWAIEKVPDEWIGKHTG